MRARDSAGVLEAITLRTTRPLGRVTAEAGSPAPVYAPGVVLEVQGAGGSAWVWLHPAAARDLGDALVELADERGAA